MEQTNNNFPRFEKGQVLTSKALNSYFGYLDEQQRLTRAKLLGVGIIDGLETKLSGNKLTITKGTAVTSDGYLIELKEDTTYNLIYEYDKKNMLAKQSPLSDAIDKDFETVLNNVKYVYYKDESDATKHNVNPKSNVSLPSDWKTTYVLALMVDFVSQDSITQCSELSCDIVQSNYQIEIRPVLMMYSCIGKDYFTNLIDPKIEVSLDKIPFPDWTPEGKIVLADGETTEGYELPEPYILMPKRPLRFFAKCFEELQGTISTEITQVSNIIDHFGELLFCDVSASDVKTIESLLDLMDQYVSGQRETNVTRFSGYYLDFLFQFRTAIKEFLTTYYEFIWKYKTAPNNTKAHPRIVVIGFGQYRRQKRALRDNSYIDDLTIIKNHLYRIISMSKSFYISNDDCVKSISNKKLSWNYIKKGAKLGERDIPGFINPEKCNSWYAHSYAKSSLLSDMKNSELDIYEQLPFLSEYDIIINNYFGKSIYDFYNEFLKIGMKLFLSHTDIGINEIYYIHVDESNPNFFSYNEAGAFVSKTEYKKAVFDAYEKSDRLKLSPSFKDTINIIINGGPINYSSDNIGLTINNIDTAIQEEGRSVLGIACDYLNRTKDYLSQFCNVYRIATIGGCPNGGDLYVFYSGNRGVREESNDSITEADSNTFITLIVGTYPGKN